jgi:plasmid stabilization system protein ParE
MADYELAPEVESDLEGVFDYTIDRWGIDQSYRYKGKLAAHFRRIGQGKAITRTFLNRSPVLQVSRCEHHYVFHIIRENKPHLIVAVLHESMDLVRRIKRRMDG